MRIPTGMLWIGGLLGATFLAGAQGPDGARAVAPKSADVDDLVSRMMAFDKDKDGKLTKAEVTDERLLRLFGRADSDSDGAVTKAELTALAEKEHVEDRGGPGGGPGGPPGGGPGGPRPGEILAPMFKQRLGLSAEQERQLDGLQKEVDERLAKILNDEQKAQLKQMRERGPGRFGPPGGGRPGGGPPGGGPPGADGGGPPPPRERPR